MNPRRHTATHVQDASASAAPEGAAADAVAAAKAVSSKTKRVKGAAATTISGKSRAGKDGSRKAGSAKAAAAISVAAEVAAATRARATQTAGKRATHRAPAAFDAPLHDWFASRGWTPLPYQREAWKRYLDGESGLIHTPTGSGKTLAAFGGPLLEALAEQTRAESAARTPARSAAPLGPRVLWVTPLRALAVDTVRALGEALEATGLPWRVAMRTGDASARDKRMTRAGRADVVVITPESLALLLSYDDTPPLLRGVRAVVVDEWHELLGDKRGVLLQLVLARLRALAPTLRLWGLSATLGNLDEARGALLPHAPDAATIAGAPPRAVHIQSLLPEAGERFPWAGHLGLGQLPRVMAALGDARTALLFANTRAQAELWHRALEAVWPYPPETLALHHGSLDPALRRAAEQGLRSGNVRCVVATSSLDLGVDFPAVERVIQLGSPKGIARLLQRAGRAEHRPGQAGTLVCVPTHALELVEYAAARQALAEGRIEARPPPRACLDVLAQHCITLALGGGFTADTLLAEVRGTHAFAALDAETWDAVLNFIVQGGSALAHYPEYRRVVLDADGVYRVPERRTALRHRLSIGTIASDGSVAVKLLKGGGLGSVEESFIGRLKPRQRFQFAGRTLELVQLKDMTAYVRIAKTGEGTVPRWQGGRMPLSTELGREVEALLREAGSGGADSADPADSPHAELRALAPLLALQRRISGLPGTGLLAEWLHARDGHHLCVYPFAGRAAHEGLAALVALRWGRLAANTFSFAANDYGFILSLQAEAALDAPLLRDLLAPDALEDDLRAGANLGELSKRHFREIARIAGLLPPSLPGRAPRALRQLQASSSLLFDVLQRFDPDHLLLAQCTREVLERQLDAPLLHRVLTDIAARGIDLRTPASFTPLSFPLWAEALRGQLSTEDWKTRVERAAARLEKQHAKQRNRPRKSETQHARD